MCVCGIHCTPQINVTRIFQQILVIGVCTAFLKVSVIGILRVSFMCQPAGLWDAQMAQMAGQTLLPGVSVRLFLEETSMGFSNHGGRLPSAHGGPRPVWRRPDRAKGRGRADLLSLLDLGCPASPALGRRGSRFSGLSPPTSFPGSLLARLSLCNLVSQCLE